MNNFRAITNIYIQGWPDNQLALENKGRMGGGWNEIGYLYLIIFLKFFQNSVNKNEATTNICAWKPKGFPKTERD